MRTLLAATLVTLTLFAGCTGTERAATASSPGGDASDPASVAASPSGVPAPTWQAGQWWKATVGVDLGFGVLQRYEGRLVVSRADDTGYAIASDSENVSIFDQYFDHFYLGAFDRSLNASVANRSVALYAWPLQPGATWTTPFPVPDVQADGVPSTNATFQVSAFEADSPDAAHRLRVQGTTDRGHAIDYDYSTRTGWMTYFRLVNASTGHILLSLDVVEAGTGFHGEVHVLTLQPLYERIAVLAPCEENGDCDPAYAGLPPAEMFMVPSGLTWIEEISFHFTFVIQAAGASESLAVVTRPSGQPDVFRHVGATDSFASDFERRQVRPATSGMWTATVHVAGTGGLFLGLFGVTDAPVTI